MYLVTHPNAKNAIGVLRAHLLVHRKMYCFSGILIHCTELIRMSWSPRYIMILDFDYPPLFFLSFTEFVCTFCVHCQKSAACPVCFWCRCYWSYLPIHSCLCRADLLYFSYFETVVTFVESVDFISYYWSCRNKQRQIRTSVVCFLSSALLGRIEMVARFLLFLRGDWSG